MKLSLQKISLTFVAGCLGGLLNALVVWAFGALGLTGALGVQLAPAFTAPWLYQRLVWGGIWGWLFLLPMGLSYPLRGLLYSLGPSCVTLFVLLPYQAQKGVLGWQLGYLTPVLVLFYNGVWGVVAGWWLTLTQRD
ncbi:MAG: hypothetical protein NTY36_12515 [Deltaproteobacteria bacterium]|nr:hypothetical protein [Deltaproteobacteria bacterium]